MCISLCNHVWNKFNHPIFFENTERKGENAISHKKLIAQFICLRVPLIQSNLLSLQLKLRN